MTAEPWYERAFSGEYLNVYAHRDDASAVAEAEFAVRALRLDPRARLLDVACGAGRHARALAAAGLRVTGTDLSAELLAAAAARGGRPQGFVRADMRRIPFRPVFHAVTMFFTSFGYFDEDGNRAVLAEVARVLVPGGGLFLDLPNRETVVSRLVPSSEREGADGSRIRELRRMTPDGRRVEKRVEIFRGDRPVEEYTESVRLYTAGELGELLGRAGLGEEARYGDLSGGGFGPGTPRLVIVGRKPC